MRARIISNINAIDARRDFFLALADLDAALLGGGGGGGGRLGDALPQIASHDERDGTSGPQLHRRRHDENREGHPQDRAGLYADGRDGRRRDDKKWRCRYRKIRCR
jgi:hypothetical protein